MWMLSGLALSLAGCIEAPAYQCSSDANCQQEGGAGEIVQGTCVVATATCVYPSAACTGINSIEGWVDGSGNCVAAPESATGPVSTTAPSLTTSSTTNDTSDTTNPDPTVDPSTTTSTTTGPTTDPETTIDPSEGESTTGDDESTTGVDPTSGDNPCAGLLDNITTDGNVSATSEFNGFPAPLSVDGSLSTSWFSTGPEGGGAPSVYTWSLPVARCVNRIIVADNAAHSNAEFREGFGFNSATVRVIDGDIPVYEELIPLPNDPDGEFVVNTGGVVATRVLLELSGHENPSCGGFSELTVIGGDAP
ncbi:MAG: hypothetical protein AAGA54_02540 [Myxococcota bacterium]